jgi:hypothetical protein
VSTLHLISDDLDEQAVGRWAAESVRRLERLLLAHARFQEYLASRDPRV